MIQYLLNTYGGKNIIDSGLSKVKSDEQKGEEFENEFTEDRNQMKIAGYLEAVGSALLFVSFLGKTFTRIGTVLINAVLGVAIFKHYKAGHGYEGSKNALKFFGLNTLSFLETFRRK